MRITKYSVEMDMDKKNILIKEDSKNCPEIDRLDTPEKVTDMFKRIYHANIKAEEHMWLLALTSKYKPIGVFEISHGIIDASIVSSREIFIRLCLCGAANFVIAHCHPSGDTTPSKEDIKVTEKIKQAGEIMNIKLTDHIIIGDGFYSFRQHKNVLN